MASSLVLPILLSAQEKFQNGQLMVYQSALGKALYYHSCNLLYLLYLNILSFLFSALYFISPHVIHCI